MRQNLIGNQHHGPQDRRQLSSDCVPADPANTVTSRLNSLLQSSGPGFVLQLCPNQRYLLQAPLVFTAPQQEISTFGYPTGSDRATLVVNGPIFSNGTGHTTAVYGNCAQCSGLILRNIQIDGQRPGPGGLIGDGNIEMGGEAVTGQLIEYVRSFNPRGWSCLHVAEGSLNCRNATVQNNDIGPCGSDVFQQWADGISMACAGSVVRNNMIEGPTDGGIVLFGAPGTHVYNNTIWVTNQTLLGGINMVDYLPWYGNYTGTIVYNNTIIGGFASGKKDSSDTDGENPADAIIKIGVAIGPRTWFGSKFGNNISFSGRVLNNNLEGAFSYAIAVSSSRNFTVQGNTLIGNTSFVGSRGPNCSNTDVTPSPQPFIVDPSTTQAPNLQSNFQNISDGNALTCVLPPNGGDFWPFGFDPSGGPPPLPGPSKSSRGRNVGIAIGVILGCLAFVTALVFIRRRAVKTSLAKNKAIRMAPPPRRQYNGF